MTECTCAKQPKVYIYMRQASAWCDSSAVSRLWGFCCHMYIIAYHSMHKKVLSLWVYCQMPSSCLGFKIVVDTLDVRIPQSHRLSSEENCIFCID